MRTPSSSLIKGVTPLKFLGLAFLLVGCASSTLTLTPREQQVLREAQTFADRIAETYKVPYITVEVGTQFDGWAISGGMALWPQGRIIIHPTRIYQDAGMDATIAHEMGHWVNGDFDRLKKFQYGSAAYLKQRRQSELEAETKAVEILQRVKGMSEKDAFAASYSLLQSVRPIVEKQRKDPASASWLANYPSPCDAIAYLLHRFPAQAGWAKPC